MAYTKQNFQPGDVLKAEELNNIEDGILAVEKQVATKQPIGNYLTSESDPTVPAWAKASKKPSYTAEEVGALPATDESVAKLAVPFITPEMFGAVGDGATDDSTAIQAAIDAAGYLGCVYLSAKTYKISTGIVFTTGHVQFKCDGIISYDGTGAAVTVSTMYLDIYINRITAPNGTALLLSASAKSVLSNKIHVNWITDSIKGVHLLTNGEDTYCISYNELHFGAVKSSEVCILAECVTSWLTENRYYCGKLSGASTGIKIINSSANKFMSGIFEDLAEDGVALHLENAEYNFFQQFRCAENYGATSVKFVGDCTGNDIQYTRIILEEVDITELTAGEYNLLGNKVKTTGGYNCGFKARVDYEFGITYDPSFANTSSYVNASTFTDNVIDKVGVYIRTNLHFTTTATNGLTFTLGKIYSTNGSMARGFPLVFKFGGSSGRITLVDVLGNTVLDNSTGAYANQTVSVRWVGYDKDNKKNVWSVEVLGETRVTSVNGATGAVTLNADDVGARPDTWLPTASEVGARPSTWMPTYSDVGADKSGTASSAVSAHNTNTSAHNDIRLLIEGLTTRLNALANSTDEDLDQMAEIVAYIKSNKTLIDSITTSKVNVTDIVNNLTTNVTNKPLSAAQGVALKALVDAITVPTKVSELTNDSGFLTLSTLPKYGGETA